MLDDHWEYMPDSEAAHMLSTSFAHLALSDKQSKLCMRCGQLPIRLENDCIFEDKLKGLENFSSQCDLCRLLCYVLKGSAMTQNDLLRFFRVGSTIRVNNKQRPAILSLYALPLRGMLSDARIQLGYPSISDAGDPRHVDILKEWLRDCDKAHGCLYSKDTYFLPTRLLDVGGPNSTRCRLICDTDGLSQSSMYLALSHRWGTHPDPSLAGKIVCTYEANIHSIVTGIEDSNFPPMYQDAITIARRVGIPFLWIDSLCIIQAEPENPNDKDKGQDFQKEAESMDLVFSSAYATIAATCAKSPAEHFLKPRPQRQFVSIQTKKISYYLAEVIDDFSKDIDYGELNNRGWVFQERALSRRMIHFAEKQTYWECGKGVRCETLTRTVNIKNSILSDANFPYALPDFDKGGRIKLYQGLYERYTRLTFTHPSDRPIAIRGMEKRLLQALETKGGYGVFEIFIHRGLLWQRDGPSLTRINFSKSPIENSQKPVPSWSWMAYDGPIRYMNIPAAAEWEFWQADVKSPWERDNDDEEGKPLKLSVLVRNIIDFALGDRVFLDEPNRPVDHEFKCVIVGSRRAPDPMRAEVYYSLIVAPVDGEEHVCERAGVAFLHGHHIDWDSPAIVMRVR